MLHKVTQHVLLRHLLQVSLHKKYRVRVEIGFLVRLKGRGTTSVGFEVEVTDSIGVVLRRSHCC